MALSFNGTTQWIDAPWTPSAVQPFTFMAWIRRSGSITDPRTVVCVGDNRQDIDFNNLVVINNTSYAISFATFAEVLGGAVSNTTNYYHMAAVFNGTNIIIYINGAATSVAWTPESGSGSFNTFSVGSTISSDAGIAANERFLGFIEHVAVWQSALTATQVGNLANQSVNPLAMDASNLRIYLPLVNDMLLDQGSLTLTAHNLSSPTYETSGISYPATSTTVNCSGILSGVPSVPAIDIDASVILNPQNLTSGTPSVPAITLGAQTNVIPANISAGAPSVPAIDIDLSITVSPVAITAGTPSVPSIALGSVVGRIIDHTNFSAASWSAAEITAAAALKVYFEHASTGEDVVGNSDTDSSVGTNHDDSASCGMHLLYDTNSRYLCDRESFDGSNDSTWFSTHNGLQANMRGNPTPALKLSGFVGMSAAMRAAAKVIMMKYCWIDVWDGSGFDDPTPGYIANGATWAAAMIEDIETLEAANPALVHVWWTMPLQSNASYPAREAFNSAVRTYCQTHSKYLIDIADIECHDTDGVKQTDVNGREIADSDYMAIDGGHLNDTGALRMGNAYWSMMAQIASELNDVTVTPVGFVSGTPSVPAITITETITANTQGITSGTPSVASTSLSVGLSVTPLGFSSGSPVNTPIAIGLSITANPQTISTGNPSVPEITIQHSQQGDCVCLGITTGAPILDDISIEVTSNVVPQDLSSGAPSVPDISVSSYIGSNCVCVDIDTGAPDVEPIDIDLTVNLTLAGITSGTPTVGAMLYDTSPPVYVRLSFRVSQEMTIISRGSNSITIVGGC